MSLEDIYTKAREAIPQQVQKTSQAVTGVIEAVKITQQWYIGSGAAREDAAALGENAGRVLQRLRRQSPRS